MYLGLYQQSPGVFYVCSPNGQAKNDSGELHNAGRRVPGNTSRPATRHILGLVSVSEEMTRHTTHSFTSLTQSLAGYTTDWRHRGRTSTGANLHPATLGGANDGGEASFVDT